MDPYQRFTLLYLHSAPQHAATLRSWLERLCEIVPLDGRAALYDAPPNLDPIEGILADWAPEYASAIPRLRKIIAPRTVPVVVLGDSTPASRAAAIMMEATCVEPFPPSPAVLEAILTRWRGPNGGGPNGGGPARPRPRSAATRGRRLANRPARLMDGHPFPAPESGPSSASSPIAAALNGHEQLTVEARIELDADRHECLVGGQPLHLPLTCFRVLEHLIANQGVCCRRKVLLDEIWGTDYIPSSDVVTTAISELRRALEPFGLRDRVRTVRGVGYVFEGETHMRPPGQGGVDVPPIGDPPPGAVLDLAQQSALIEGRSRIRPGRRRRRA